MKKHQAKEILEKKKKLAAYIRDGRYEELKKDERFKFKRPVQMGRD